MTSPTHALHRWIATILLLAIVPFSTGVKAQTQNVESVSFHFPQSSAVFETGLASYYDSRLEGRITTSGERYDPQALTAAHPTLPFGTNIRVFNTENNRSVVVRINDRGPFVKGRIIDLSFAAARQLDLIGQGMATVELIKEASTLSTDPKTTETVVQYVVQLGSFGGREAADAMAREIPGAWVQEVQIDNNNLYRVHYGVFDNREDAERARAHLSRQGYVKRLVLPANKPVISSAALLPDPQKPNTEKDSPVSDSNDFQRNDAQFTVQLASFELAGPADAMVSKLSGAWKQTFSLNGENGFRVYYGTYNDISAAEAAHHQLREQGYEGFVKRLQSRVLAQAPVAEEHLASIDSDLMVTAEVAPSTPERTFNTWSRPIEKEPSTKSKRLGF